MSTTRVLIVDDDRQLCDYLQEVFSSWGIAAENVGNPHLVADVMRKTFYHLLLSNFALFAMASLELLTQIADLFPETKIIVMTGCIDKSKAVNALKLGAFDFLEEPLNTDLLAHVVQRALNTQKIERELRDTNTALDVLAYKIERTRDETKRQMISTIRAIVLPLIEQLRQDKRLRMCEPQFAMVVHHIDHLADGIPPCPPLTSVLSSSELRVACLIIEGMKSDQIAAHLHLSPDTVKTHRRNIRRKLGLIGTNNDLRIYLQLFGVDPASDLLPRSGGSGYQRAPLAG